MVEKYKNINYIIELPKNYNEENKYPVIISLHGSGSRGEDVNILKTSALFKYKENSEDYPFILVMPQCHKDSWFDIFEQLQDFVNFICSQKYADVNRIYLCGISMGGYASYQLLMTIPDIFAASVICCGGGMYWNAARIKASLLIFHGKEDSSVYPDESVKMYNALKKAGRDATLILLDDTKHNCWDYAFSKKSTYDFMLKNILKR